MIQPVIHDNLSQIFAKHYKMQPRAAAEAALKFMDILELYQMQLIIGDWIVPETVVIRPTAFEMLIETQKETMEREPWLAREIQ